MNAASAARSFLRGMIRSDRAPKRTPRIPGPANPDDVVGAVVVIESTAGVPLMLQVDFEAGSVQV